MGLMSQDLFDAIRLGQTVFPVLELDIGGTTKRYSSAYAEIDSLGMYDGNVINWSPIARGISIVGNTLRSLNTTVVIDDTSRDLDQVTQGQYSRTVRGGAARIKLVSPDALSSSYFTAYSGIISDYAKTGPFEYTFALTTNDEPLKGRIRTPKISKWDFPNANDSARDQPVPLILGVHDSTNTDSLGFIPTQYVDTSGFQYLLMQTSVKSIDEVWVDGTPTASGWALNEFTINGRSYSTIDFTADQTTAEIRVDVNGMTDDGTSSGTVITNPAEQLKLILALWVFNETQDPTGAMAVPAGTPINEDSFDTVANYFDILSIESSRYITGEETGEEILNEWCKNHGVYSFWNNNGELSLAVNSWYIPDIYDDNDDLRTFSHSDELGVFRYLYDTSILADEISTNFVYSSTDNAFQRSIRIKDTLRGVDRREELDLYWSRADDVT